MEKLRLAVFNTQPPLYLGGVERRIQEIAKRLSPKADITIYSGTKSGLHQTTTIEGATVVPCSSTDRLFPLDNWTFNRTLAKMAGQISADVYESHTVSGYGFQQALLKKQIKAPFITTVHGVLGDEYAQAKLLGGLSTRGKVANFFMGRLAKIEQQSAQNATLVVTISEYSQNKIVKLYGVPKEKIRIVPNGIDASRFKPATEGCQEFRTRIRVGNRQVVLFVGRLIPRKGVRYFMEAAKIILKERQETQFVLVGNGPLKEKLVADVKAAGMAGNFTFLGDVSDDDLVQAHQCADVFMFPSIQEGQGIALLEAQACAKPVVAFSTSGVSEAVRSGETGILVEAGDSWQLAKATLKLLANDALREKMGAAGRSFVRAELSWDVCAFRMLGVYREAINLV